MVHADLGAVGEHDHHTGRGLLDERVRDRTNAAGDVHPVVRRSLRTPSRTVTYDQVDARLGQVPGSLFRHHGIHLAHPRPAPSHR